MKAVRFGLFPLVTAFALLALIVVAAFVAVFPQAGSSPVSASGSVKVALEGDTAPSPINTLARFGPPDVNDVGQVAFYAQGAVYGVLRYNPAAPPPGLQVIASDGSSSFGTLYFGSVLNEPAVINSVGAVAFSAVITTASGVCPAPPCKAIFWSPGPGNPLVLVAAEKQGAPLGGTFGPPTLLDSAEGMNVLFVATITGGSGPIGLFHYGTSPSRIAAVNDPLPSAAGGGTITGFGREDGSALGSCKDNIDNGSDGMCDLGACTGADAGKPGDPDCAFAALDSSTPPRVVFHATRLGGTYPSSPEGIYRSQGGVIDDIALANVGTWEGDPGFGATLTAVGQPSINDSNQVAFYGTSSGPYGSGYFLASLASPHEDGSASCFDNVDNGGDGAIDGNDSDCTASTTPYEDSNASCSDGIDNGGDTVMDANDPDCQLVAAKQVLANDPSVVGDTFGGGGGCTFGLKGGLGPNRLNDGGQVVVDGCGGDPTEAIITVPQFHKQVILNENLGSVGNVVSVGNASISKGSATMDSQLAFAASVTAGGCGSPPCDGLFKVTNSCTVDSDGDGLNNCWENNGIDINNDSTVDLNLPAMGANANRKDIFVEADYMDCSQKGCGSEDGAGLGTCGDGIDNGGDGTKDLADADCIAVGADTHSHRPITETVWNYEDGAGPGSCADAKDNGKDGFTDAADPDCVVALAAASLAEDGFPPGTCTDGIDNGGDTTTDAADSDCKVGTVVQGFANAPVANPLLNPSGITLHVIVDEAIPHRQYMNFWVPEDGTASCFDGIDNSGDGMCDSGGPACGGLPADPDCGQNGIGFEDENASCNDGVDNGGDGKIDAADPDCGVYDFDAAGGKPTYFGTATERASANWKWIKKAKRQVFHYVIYTHQQAPGGKEDGAPSSLSCGDGIDNGNHDGADAADTDCKGVGSSGIAEIWGNDFMVSLGAFAHEDGKQAGSCFDGIDNGGDGKCDVAGCVGVPLGDPDCTSGVVGDQDEQEGTFMHELGHNLNLRHGGIDNINYKPNYLSIMNYTFQFDWNVGAGNRPLDYSRWWLPPFGSANEDGKGAGKCNDGIDNGGDGLRDGADPDCQGLLNETDLNEDRGIDTWVGLANPTGWNSIWKWTAYSVYDPTTTKCLLKKVSIVGAIDWDGDTVIEGNTRAAPNNNNVIAFINDPRGVGGAMCASDPEKLVGFADWPVIKYDFRPAADYSDGLPNAPLPQNEALPNEAAPAPSAVGGIAELPDVAETAPGRQSDSSAGGYAALAGGLAVAVMILGAGAWYGRRRWLR